MSEIKSYEDLKVWQMSISLVQEVYSISSSFPKTELYGLLSQIKRSAVSIPSNIAEGNARSSRADYARFISISIGSVAELKTQLIIARNLGFIALDDFDKVLDKLVQIDRMLKRLWQKA